MVNRSMYRKILVATFFIFQALATNAESTVATDEKSSECAKVSAETCSLSLRLGRGINMGGMLESPVEGDWGTRLDPKYIDIVTAAFSTVRVPVRWSNHASKDAAAVLDPFFLKRVTNAVDALLNRGAYVIVDMHHYQQLMGLKRQNKEFDVDESVVEERFLNIWKQLALHFKGRSNKLIFELLNEPVGKLDERAWNKLLLKAIAVVRETNPDRVVMIGPVGWGHPKALSSLVVPVDKNIIVTFHTYDPFNFTHQGATYLPMNLPLGVQCCDGIQKQQISSSIKIAKSWSVKNGYPVYLGEFGVMKLADEKSRANYARYVRDEAESNRISWAYWDFANAFGIYNPVSGEWIESMRASLLD